MEDFIVLYVFKEELLICGACECKIRDDEAYLIHFQVNHKPTAHVRCKTCYYKEKS